ncbi:flagellar hook-length control protein FliK [Thalassolituus sp.]|uniref:flagellar hook-length control protein FliK n=1 Tax=Thalassolituus sp. TaxID=2030822 RepID=UPI00260EC6FE|nr:flagellar hook-length control protein FliK [Thalassolituus sp.]
MNPSLPNSPMASLLMSLGGNIDFQDLKLSGDGASGLSDFSSLLDEMQLQPLDSGENSGIPSALAAMPEGQNLPLDLPLETDIALSEGGLSLLPVEESADVSGRELMGDTLMAQIQKGKDISVRYADTEVASDGRMAENSDDTATDLEASEDAALTTASDRATDTASPLAAATVSPMANAIRSQNSGEIRQQVDQRATGKSQLTAAAANPTESVSEDAEGELVSDVFKPVTADDTRPETSGFRESLLNSQGSSATVQTSVANASAQTQPVAATTAAAANADLVNAESTGEEVASEDYTFEEGFEQKLQRQFRERLEFGQDRREWTPALGARLVTMVANDVQQARIQLDPPELGSLEIRMQVQNDQASVQVSAQSHQVKDVLDNSAQRLRDALAAEGIELSEFSVSADSGGQGRDGASDNSDGSNAGFAGGSGAEGEEVVGINQAHTPAPDSLLDTFA